MEIAVGKLTRDNFKEFSTKGQKKKFFERKFLQISTGTLLLHVKEKQPGNENSAIGIWPAEIKTWFYNRNYNQNKVRLGV